MKEKKEKIKAIVSSHTHQHLSCSLFFVLTYYIFKNKDPKKKKRNNQDIGLNDVCVCGVYNRHVISTPTTQMKSGYEKI